MDKDYKKPTRAASPVSFTWASHYWRTIIVYWALITDSRELRSILYRVIANFVLSTVILIFLHSGRGAAGNVLLIFQVLITAWIIRDTLRIKRRRDRNLRAWQDQRNRAGD